MLIDAAAAHMVEMAVVKVVYVARVANDGVAATGAVAVSMRLMFSRGSHAVFPSPMVDVWAG